MKNTTRKDCKESYLITNKPNAQLFKAKLNVLNDGRAILKANYTSYSGVKINLLIILTAMVMK